MSPKPPIRRSPKARKPSSPTPKPTAPRKISPARRAAVQILLEVSAGRAHSDNLLHAPALANLSPADQHLTTTLVMGVLRWQIALDAQIRPLLTRPDQKLPEVVSIALRLGLFQLLHLSRIPPHAALSESVEICRAASHEYAGSMVNAVLRKLSAAPSKPPSLPLYESTASFAQRLSHPLWLVNRWVKHFGRAAALSICAADQNEPTPGNFFLAKPQSPPLIPQTSASPDVSALEASPERSDPFDSSDAELAQPIPPDTMPVMDDGSRLVAELAAAALPPTPNRLPRVWDCCAAPGGKTLVLARRLPIADLLATDISPRRLALTKTRLDQANLPNPIRTLATGAAALPTTEAPFDLILADVPCSGTGTLSRNPEIRLRLQPEDLLRQAARQREILTSALQHLAPGGRLVYSTCSLEPEECEQIISSIPGLQPLSVPPFLEELRTAGILNPQLDLATLTRDGALRTLPGIHPCDGFYATILERT